MKSHAWSATGGGGGGTGFNGLLCVAFSPEGLPAPPVTRRSSS
ncbi:hypothetical protein [Streptomyces sp. NPDC048357]